LKKCLKAWNGGHHTSYRCVSDAECSGESGSDHHDGPAPAPAPAPEEHGGGGGGQSDVHLRWVSGRGHGACQGKSVQGDDVVQILPNNGIKLSTNRSPPGGCVFRTGEPSINLDEFAHVEVDIESSGNREAYGEKAGQWFSFWMFPPGYAYAHGIGNSGEIDFVENIPKVRSNFAGCQHNCHETSWGMPSNKVRAHVTMHYDKARETVNVYHCEHGAATCGTSGDRAYVELKPMVVHKPYMYTFTSDVWYAHPGMDFEFTVTNLRILRDAAWANATSTAAKVATIVV
jgi:hypothetical protein